MADLVYVETTIVSYLKARPSRDVVIAGHQQITRDWWDRHRQHFDLCASQLVLQEASAGDPEAARERLEALESTMLLETNEQALALARNLLDAEALPATAADDALHIAIAAVNAVPYLLTWNCRHMNNATMRPLIESVCRS